MDKFTSKQRSYTMSRIRGKNTKPELLLFQKLESLGIEFEKHSKMLGNPDATSQSSKLAIFIDGDFWHGRDYLRRRNTLPQYWVEKIARTMKRDKRYTRLLKKEGWKVIRVWEHQILNNPEKVIIRIQKYLKK